MSKRVGVTVRKRTFAKFPKMSFQVGLVQSFSCIILPSFTPIVFRHNLCIFSNSFDIRNFLLFGCIYTSNEQKSYLNQSTMHCNVWIKCWNGTTETQTSFIASDDIFTPHCRHCPQKRRHHHHWQIMLEELINAIRNLNLKKNLIRPAHLPVFSKFLSF